MTYSEFFTALTRHKPNPFQERIAEAILGEKNVILRAPTGSGKTWAVVAPYLYALAKDSPVADRLLYALPLRSLATSLYKSTQSDVIRNPFVNKFTNEIRIQTGERREDDRFDGRVTFTTIDQLLSSYLLQPVSLPSRCGNLNAGAILGGLICFDEFHLLDPSKSMATAIEMLDTVAVRYPVSRFVLMTATLSSSSLSRLKSQLNAEYIDVPETEADKLPMQQFRSRRYVWRDEPLSATAVAREHCHGRTIVVVNTVRKAQELYRELQSEECRSLLGSETRIRLLHSRFFTKDRERHEFDLADWYGPEAKEIDVILVSTQVIEAGMDFSCDNLHTELAPMNALVQRAGRCARRANQTGTVWCYSLDRTNDGKLNYGPYIDFEEIVKQTALTLAETIGGGGRTLKYHDELSLVDQVQSGWEEKHAVSVRETRPNVRQAQNRGNPAAVRQLIRDVDSINVIITDSPESLHFDNRKWPEMLSIPRRSLHNIFNPDAASDSLWSVKIALERDVTQNGSIVVDWTSIDDAFGLQRAGWLIAIHPSRACYSPEIGLVIGQSGDAPRVVYRERPVAVGYRYKMEVYEDHVRRVRSAGRKQESSYHIATRRIAALLGITSQKVCDWLDLLWALHDVGKLSVEWQDAIWEWQASKSGVPAEPRPVLAHSDYDPEIDYLASRRASRRPPHAAEGAFAVRQLLEDLIGNYAMGAYRASITAIVRHHSPDTGTVNAFSLIANAEALVTHSLEQELTVPLAKTGTPRERKSFTDEDLFQCTDISEEKFLPLYLYLSRRLRLADQGSFLEN